VLVVGRTLMKDDRTFGIAIFRADDFASATALAEADPAEAASAGSTAAAPRATTIAALILRLARIPPSPSIVLVPRLGRGSPLRWVNARPCR